MSVYCSHHVDERTLPTGCLPPGIRKLNHHSGRNRRPVASRERKEPVQWMTPAALYSIVTGSPYKNRPAHPLQSNLCNLTTQQKSQPDKLAKPDQMRPPPVATLSLSSSQILKMHGHRRVATTSLPTTLQKLLGGYSSECRSGTEEHSTDKSLYAGDGAKSTNPCQSRPAGCR